MEVANLLLAKGAVTYSALCEMKQENNVLHKLAKYGGDREILKSILDQGYGINCKGKNNKTPLHFAAASGHRNLVEALVKAGADVNSLTTFL